jgi:hypothetical protein
MRRSAPARLLVLGLLLSLLPAAKELHAQTETVTVAEMGAGIYIVNSPATGSRFVSVLPLGGGTYSLYSDNTYSSAMQLAPGSYAVFSSTGARLGSVDIVSRTGDVYSITVTNGLITSVILNTSPSPTRQPIQPPVLPNYTIKAPPDTTANTLALAQLVVLARQQCAQSGGVMYAEHWYSAPRCVSPDVPSEKTGIKLEKKIAKKLKREPWRVGAPTAK